MGVIGSAATLQLSYFHAEDGLLPEPMHLSANLGRKLSTFSLDVLNRMSRAMPGS